MIAFICSVAKCWPMHMCAPPPNGAQANACSGLPGAGTEALGIERMRVPPQRGHVVRVDRKDADHRVRRDHVVAKGVSRMHMRGIERERRIQCAAPRGSPVQAFEPLEIVVLQLRLAERRALRRAARSCHCGWRASRYIIVVSVLVVVSCAAIIRKIM